MVFCSKCGTQIPSGGKFCPKCGAPSPTNSGQGRVTSPPARTKQPMADYNESRSKSPQPVNSSRYNNSPAPISINRATPPVKSIASGNAHGERSTTYYDMETNTPGVMKGGLPPPTYEKQPDWAYAERHKNANLRYKDGQFRHHNI